MPRMQIERDRVSGCIRFTGEVEASTLIKLRLDPVDGAVVSDWGEGAADWLLALEVIFRRAQEQGL